MHYQLLERWLSNRELTVVDDVWQLIFVRLYLNTIPAPPNSMCVLKVDRWEAYDGRSRKVWIKQW